MTSYFAFGNLASSPWLTSNYSKRQVSVPAKAKFGHGHVGKQKQVSLTFSTKSDPCCFSIIPAEAKFVGGRPFFETLELGRRVWTVVDVEGVKPNEFIDQFTGVAPDGSSLCFWGGQVVLPLPTTKYILVSGEYGIVDGIGDDDDGDDEKLIIAENIKNYGSKFDLYGLLFAHDKDKQEKNPLAYLQQPSWCNFLRRSTELEKEITMEDHFPLAALRGIKSQVTDYGFSLSFMFEDCEFFPNLVLTKKVFLENSSVPIGSQGCTIDWYPRMSLTGYPHPHKERESFFQFFQSVSSDAESYEDLEKIESDYMMAQAIRNVALSYEGADVAKVTRPTNIKVIHVSKSRRRKGGSPKKETKKKVKWTPPTDGAWKVNVDVSVDHNNNLGAAGGLIRDSKGIWVSGFRVDLGQTSVLEAKLQAVLHGLILAKEHGGKRIIVESDSQEVARHLHGQTQPDHVYWGIISRCKELMGGGDWVCEVINVPQEVNKAADFMAKLLPTHDLTRTVYSSPPPGLGCILAADIYHELTYPTRKGKRKGKKGLSPQTLTV